MTTAVTPPRSSAAPSATGSRSAFGWRTATKMAWFDLRANLRRNILLSLLLAIPIVLLIIGPASDALTKNSHKAVLKQNFGSAQALAIFDSRSAGAYTSETPANRVAELERILGAPVTATYVETPSGSSSNSLYFTADHQGKLKTRYIERPDVITPPATLTSGRWPRKATEILVTPLGIKNGLPVEGTVTLFSNSGDHRARTFTVVGTGTGYLPAQSADAILHSSALDHARTFLVGGDGNFTAEQRDALAAKHYRLVERHQATVESADKYGSDTPAYDGLINIVLASVLLLLLAAMIIKPAFGLVAQNQAQNIGLLQRNGAAPHHVQRIVTAQSVLLGVTAWLASTLVVGLIVGIRWFSHRSAPENAHTVFTIPWLWWAGALIFAIAVSTATAHAYLVGTDWRARNHIQQPRRHTAPPQFSIWSKIYGSFFLLAAIANVIVPVQYGMGAVTLLAGAMFCWASAPWLVHRCGAMFRFAPSTLRLAGAALQHHHVASARAVVSTIAAVTLFMGFVSVSALALTTATTSTAETTENVDVPADKWWTIHFAPTVTNATIAQTRQQLNERFGADAVFTVQQVQAQNAKPGDRTDFLTITSPQCPANTTTSDCRETNTTSYFDSPRILVVPAERISAVSGVPVEKIRQGALVTSLIDWAETPNDETPSPNAHLLHGTATLADNYTYRDVRTTTERTVPAISARPLQSDYRYNKNRYLAQEYAAAQGFPLSTTALVVDLNRVPQANPDSEELAKTLPVGVYPGTAYTNTGTTMNLRGIVIFLAILLTIVATIAGLLAATELRKTQTVYRQIGAHPVTTQLLPTIQAVLIAGVAAFCSAFISCVALAPGIAREVNTLHGASGPDLVLAAGAYLIAAPFAAGTLTGLVTYVTGPAQWLKRRAS